MTFCPLVPSSRAFIAGSHDESAFLTKTTDNLLFIDTVLVVTDFALLGQNTQANQYNYNVGFEPTRPTKRAGILSAR